MILRPMKQNMTPVVERSDVREGELLLLADQGLYRNGLRGWLYF